MYQYSIDIAAVTDKGNVKEVNQDSIIAKVGEYKGEEFGLFAVCDGLGGLSCGEVASQLAVKQLNKWWHEEIRGIVKSHEDGQIINSLKNVIWDCNNKIRDYSEEINERVGTTISVLLLLKEKYYIVHVGDSRIYKIDSKIKQLTEDHSYVAMKVRNGEMTASEAKKSNNRNLLLQCVGVKENLDIYTKTGTIKGNEKFIVCSDGFYNSYEDSELLKSMKFKKNIKNGLLQEHISQMVKLVKDRKERDNISVILVKLKKNQLEKSIFNKLFK